MSDIKTGTLDRFAGLVGSAIAKKIADGFNMEMVSDSEQKMRIALCEACPDFRTDSRTCAICSCPMDYKTQLKFNPYKLITGDSKQLVSCPKNLW